MPIVLMFLTDFNCWKISSGRFDGILYWKTSLHKMYIDYAGYALIFPKNEPMRTNNAARHQNAGR